MFAFDEFGPLVIRPQARAGWAPAGHPHRLPANYHKLHGVRQFHGCYSVGDDQLWGVVRRRKSAANTLAALKSIRAARPDGAPINVILDNLSAYKGRKIRAPMGFRVISRRVSSRGSPVSQPGAASKGAIRSSGATTSAKLGPA
ncbi:hypothetical protein B0E53_06237 [Micromonospora sp. MH33]|nr:hypothetical protein [Micromonospora sp. MH33]PSK61865.1 hypothetical protein B0E53_06237 [Micromonospora sp. MH33]